MLLNGKEFIIFCQVLKIVHSGILFSRPSFRAIAHFLWIFLCLLNFSIDLFLTISVPGTSYEIPSFKASRNLIYSA